MHCRYTMKPDPISDVSAPTDSATNSKLQIPWALATWHHGRRSPTLSVSEVLISHTCIHKSPSHRLFHIQADYRLCIYYDFVRHCLTHPWLSEHSRLSFCSHSFCFVLFCLYPALFSGLLYLNFLVCVLFASCLILCLYDHTFFFHDLDLFGDIYLHNLFTAHASCLNLQLNFGVRFWSVPHGGSWSKTFILRALHDL